MDVKYFKEHIKEELSGVDDYLKQSELAGNDEDSQTEASKKFIEMAKQELGHAKTLYSMFEEHIKSVNDLYDELGKAIRETEDKL